jgi:hypothetical protein
MRLVLARRSGAEILIQVLSETGLRRRMRRLPLAFEAAALLIAASAAVALLPDPWLSRLLGDAHQPGDRRPQPAPDPASRRVGHAVESVARRLPWRPACLAQALATRAMLRRRGIPCLTHLGVVGTGPLAAHAWVTVNGAVVQGGAVAEITEVAVFR